MVAIVQGPIAAISPRMNAEIIGMLELPVKDDRSTNLAR